MTEKVQTSANQQLLYTRKQVARLLGNVSTATVRRLEREGRLRGVRLSKSRLGTVFFRADDVLAFIEEAN
jgi:DNA-binding transcriptional MerR regulator